MSRPSDFDWKADTVVGSQLAIAVYKNHDGDIVIRQEMAPYNDEDGFVFVRPENATYLAAALMALAEPDTAPQLALPAPADRTAAERQRRHRDRKRNGSVTPCDRDSVTGDRDTISGRVLAAN